MKIKYECEYCRKQFDTKVECQKHEILHLHDVDKLKYYVTNVLNDDLCSYCANSYYVYGCERSCAYHNCNHKNNYRYFEKENVNYDF